MLLRSKSSTNQATARLRTARALARVSGTVATAAAQGQPPVYCDGGATTASTAAPIATTQLKAGQPGHQIGAGSVTVTFSGGTGVNCATAKVDALTITLENNVSNVDHMPTAFIALAAGHSLCWTLTGTGTVQGSIYFGQFVAR